MSAVSAIRTPGQVSLALLEVGHDRTNAVCVALAVAVGERLEHVGRTAEGHRLGAHPGRRSAREAVIALQQRDDPSAYQDAGESAPRAS